MDAEDLSPSADDLRSDPSGSGAGETTLACNGCRRRKLRCSREQPACQQCRKLGCQCLYETKKTKPGMKAGAIDNIHRRLDALEKRVESNDTNPHVPSSSTCPRSNEGAYNILSFFAKELQRFNQTREKQDSIASDVTTLPSDPNDHNGNDMDVAQSPKRRRLNHNTSTGQHEARVASQSHVPKGLAGDELNDLLDAYFRHVHPWIPILHQSRFRQRLVSPVGREQLSVVLQAIVLGAARFIENRQVADAVASSHEEQEHIRDWVVSTAMKELSIENLQALIIVAFTDIGNGLAFQAWSLIGSLTRIVEYLQLAVELDETDRSTLSQPHVSLAPPEDWTEAEERRRVFWTVFNLDRFCSVTMGWNTSLTSDDVNRRLPCDGISWRKEDPVVTPYLGIWDKAAGRIGNPIAFLPSHYAAAATAATHHSTEDDHIATPSDVGTSPGANAAQIDMSTIGAFAYSIETTESLSRITTYFLQQKVNMHDHGDVSRWLTRFKELDLRLVHWKMLLPQKWKVNTAPGKQQSSRMDPNLTLAHVTHNASMILLHQPIAFPLQDWPFRNRLPSSCSVDTCQTAAFEIATITDNYLSAAPLVGPWRYMSQQPLAPEFWSLVQSLDTMARRWMGPHATLTGHLRNNLPAKYSAKLVQLQQLCNSDETFRISVLGYTTEISHSKLPSDAMQSAGLNRDGDHLRGAMQSSNNTQEQANTTTAGAPHHPIQGNPAYTQFTTTQFPFSAQMADGGASHAMRGSSHSISPSSGGGGHMNMAQHDASRTTDHGELGAISQMLLGQQFMDMDRIISYDDGMFRVDNEGGW